jgi:hypothetical protein
MHRCAVHTRLYDVRPPETIYNTLESFTVNGKPYRELESQFISDPRFDPRFTKSFSDLNIALFTLAALGLQRAQIRTLRTAPDFEVVLSDGSQVFLEIAAVVSSAVSRYHAFIAQLNADIRRLIFHDPSLQERLRNTYAELLLPRVPSAEMSEVWRELLRIVKTEQLTTEETTIEAVPATYRILHEVGAQIIKMRPVGDYTHFAIREPARAVGPYDLVGLALRKLEQKRTQFQNVEANHLWLSLYFADPAAISETNLKLLAQQPPNSIAPFERVFAGDQRRMLEYYAETPGAS